MCGAEGQENGHPEGWPSAVSEQDRTELPLVLAPVNEIAQSRGRAGDGLLVLLVVLHNLPAGLVANRAQAEAHLLLFHVDLDDLEFVFVVLLELRRLAVVAHCFGDVAETLHTLGNLDERAELSRAQHLAVHHVAHAMGGEEALPDVGLELLDAQREAAVLRLDAENDSLHFFALLHDLGRMLDALGPAQVRNVNQAVDAVFDFDEGAEVGEVAYAAFDNGSGRVALGEVLPRVFEQLLHAERDAAVTGIDAEDDRLDLVAGLDQLGGVLEALGPGHLGEVNEAFNSLLQLDERAVIGDRENASMDACAHRVALRGIEPGVRRELLKAERDALLILVELEHLDLNLVADVDQVAGMREASPAHVGDVQQAVDSAEVNERAVVGQVLHGAGKHRSLPELLHGVGALGGLL